MRICQVTYTGFGGLGSVVFSLLASDPAHNQWSIAFIGDLPLDPSYERRCQELGIPYAAFQSTPGRPYAAWRRLARWLSSSRPEVVICHTTNSVLACRWYAWLHGAKLVCVEHTANQVKPRSERIASKLGMLLADKVVVLTPQYRDELRKAHGLIFRASKVVVIPSGIDLNVFHPAPASSPVAGKLRFGMAGRFSFSKRQGMLVSVAERVAELRPDWSVEVSFAGDGDEFERVRTDAAALRRARVQFEGRLSEAEVAAWLRSLDLYVHATDGETLSTSLLQAMATGTPIVASDVPGVRNLLIGSDLYGVCVPNTVEDFAQAIIRLVEERQFAADLARRARGHVSEKYGLQAMWDNYSVAMGR